MQIEFSNIHRVENKSHLQVFREINVPSDLIVEMLISETFREKMVRVNFRNFHTVVYLLQSQLLLMWEHPDETWPRSIGILGLTTSKRPFRPQI